MNVVKADSLIIMIKMNCFNITITGDYISGCVIINTFESNYLNEKITTSRTYSCIDRMC